MGTVRVPCKVPVDTQNVIVLGLKTNIQLVHVPAKTGKVPNDTQNVDLNYIILE